MLGWSGRAGDDVEGLLRVGVASMSLGAAVIHAAVVPDHQGLPLHVAFFLVTAAVQSGLAAVVLRSRSGRWLALTAACNAVIAAIWVVSRTTGVPVEGVGAAEPIGFKDAISTLLEIGVVAGGGLVAFLPEASRRVRLGVNSRASTVMTAGIWGLAVTGLVAPHTHDDHLHLHGPGVEAAVESHHFAPGVAHGHDDDQSSMLMIDRPRDPMVRGLSAHHDPVRRDRNHHDDVRSEAFTDDGPAPPHDRTEHGRCHQPDSDSIDRSDGTGDGQAPGSPAQSAGRLIDDVMRLLETVPRHTTALEVSP
jgi:hypothetical protein